MKCANKYRVEIVGSRVARMTSLLKEASANIQSIIWEERGKRHLYNYFDSSDNQSTYSRFSIHNVLEVRV